jgi:hypothetical protein
MLSKKNLYQCICRKKLNLIFVYKYKILSFNQDFNQSTFTLSKINSIYDICFFKLDVLVDYQKKH